MACCNLRAPAALPGLRFQELRSVGHLYSRAMSTPLLATKLFVPPPPNHAVLRPLLVTRLDGGVSRKLTLVCAAAGFGKSTLVSQWAHECAYPSAWLSLDEGDQDINRFLAYLVASLQTVEQAVGLGTAALLEGSPPASAETVLTSLLNQLSTMPGKLVLILDDYHLAASSPVNEALTFLIDHMPAQLHLVVASREEPDVSLGRLRVTGQLTEIRQEELRFGLDEATAFFNQGLDLGLSNAQVNALEARTEGWIAGLKLAAISLHQHQDPETFIASFTGSHRFVQDYLIEEVLHQQPPDVQSFLLRTSVLDRLCGPLCDAVLQSQAGEHILHRLDHANLFMVPLDAEKRWYRYHHLFGDLLRQRLAQLEPAEPLHLRASHWYEANGLEVEAFRQATAAKDIARAMRLIEGNGMPFYFRGETATVLHWLSSQSHVVLNAHPFLWVAFAWSLFISGQPSQIEAKLKAAEAALTGSETDSTSNEIKGQIAVLWAWRAVSRSQVDLIDSHARLALGLLNPDSRPARTAAQCALGVAQLFSGARAEASKAFSQVIDAGRTSGNVMFTVVASIALAGIHASDYKLHEAATTYREVIAMIPDPTHLVGYEAHLGLARILYDWNQLDEAASHAQQSSQLSARAESESGLGSDLLRARLLFVQNDVVAAESLLEATAVAARTRRFSGRMKEAADLQVLHMLRRGDVEKAADWASQHTLPLAQARVLLAQHRGLEALRCVEAYRDSVQSKGLTQETVKAMVVQTLILDAVGDRNGALQVLHAAVEQAEPQGSIRLFADEGKPMQALLTRLENESGKNQFVSVLLRTFGEHGLSRTQPAVEALVSPSQLPPNAFSQRELEVLRLIQEGHSNQNISERLFVSLSTVKWHNQNLFSKLGVQRRTEAIARALELKLL